MTTLALTIACHPYDRVQALRDGSVPIEGCNIEFFDLRAEEAFHRAFNGSQFDISEMSMSSYLLATARGFCDYVAIPVFTSRIFRHSSIYIRRDRGINSPADLSGKLVGVPEFQMTAALWARGMLHDEYGVEATSIRWRSGGLEEPGREEKFGLTFGDGLDVQAIAEDKALSPMLASGELDAMVSARAPSCFSKGDPNIAKLFGDSDASEKEYFRKTGIFPIMHVIGIRKELVERHPWLPVSVFKAFSEAKKRCQTALSDLGALEVMLPWLKSHLDETVALMGKNYWPYGVQPNRKALEAMVRYSFEQRLSPRLLRVDELFAPTTYSESRV